MLAEVIARLLRNKKILKQAEERARRKALYLALEIEEDREEVSTEELNYPTALVGIEFSPAI